MFSRISENILSVARWLSDSPSSAAPPFKPSAQSLQADLSYGFNFSSSGEKNNLRLSSSLQDLSVYHRLDLEKDDLYGMHLHSLERENGMPSFSKEKPLLGTPNSRRKLMRVFMCLFCLSLFAFLTFFAFNFFYYSWSRQASKFSVVLDCGSTGNRVYIYEASINDKKKDGSFPIMLKSFPSDFYRKSISRTGRAYNRIETEPGLDKLVHNISGLRAAINPLLQWAEEKIPTHSHKTASLFLCATAGVRRLTDPDAEWLLNNVWSILKGSPFLCRRDWVKIISGIEEAYYGWLSLNYLKGVLGTIPKRETYGALDLGGSSLQVTFESNQRVSNETTVSLSFGTVKYYLNAYSLPGYGLNDAFDKSVVHLFKRHIEKNNKADLHNRKIELPHPCLQSGYRDKYQCFHCAPLYDKGGFPPASNRNSKKDGKPGFALTLVGAPKWEECSALVKVTVNLSEWSGTNLGINCELQPCALAKSFPRPYGEFYTMSGFYVVFRFFNLTSDATLTDLLDKGQEFCHQPWRVVKNSVPPQPFIEQYCFRAPYIVLLLREGLQVTDGHVNIGLGSITWTLGVALLQTGKPFPTRLGFYGYYQMLRMKINPVMIFAILFFSLLILVCLLTSISSWMPRLRRLHLPHFGRSCASTASVLHFQHWSPINSGGGRAKLPLSPTVASTPERSFNIQLMDSFATSRASHSYSSGSLGQMQGDGGGIGSFHSSHRSQMRLQSRRSLSREDLNASLTEAHMGKA